MTIFSTKVEIFCYQEIMRTESGCSGEVERKLCKLKLHTDTFAQFQTKKAIYLLQADDVAYYTSRTGYITISRY